MTLPIDPDNTLSPEERARRVRERAAADPEYAALVKSRIREANLAKAEADRKEAMRAALRAEREADPTFEARRQELIRAAIQQVRQEELRADPEHRAALRQAIENDPEHQAAMQDALRRANEHALAEARQARWAEAIRVENHARADEHRAAKAERLASIRPRTLVAADSDAEPLPDFVIIGAQKSATRWLRLNLGLHPEVFTSDLELSFFNDPDNFRHGAEWYADQFEGWDGETIVGEATPGYMIWRHDPSEVAERMVGFKPELKLIAVLRNPIDRAYSGLVHHLRRGRLPADTELLDYVRSKDPLEDRLCLITGSWYAASLTPYRERFGDQLLVMLHDDIKETPDTVYETALAHIGATPGFLPEELAAVRYGNTPPKESGLRRQQGSGYRELTVSQRWALWDFFADDVARLEDMLGRDLSMWRPAEPPG